MDFQYFLWRLYEKEIFGHFKLDFSAYYDFCFAKL